MLEKLSTCLTLFALLMAMAVIPAEAAEEAKVDLNTATLEQLDTLPGIGPSTAQKIIEFREKNGPFKKVEDLMNVRGIGEKKFLQLKDRITIKATAPAVKPTS